MNLRHHILSQKHRINPLTRQTQTGQEALISSKDEENTKILLRDVLTNTREFLVRRVVIELLGKEVVMRSTSYRRSFPIFNLLTHRYRDTTKFRLGMQTIIAINDGGLGVRYNTGEGPVDWQPGGIRPVLALEVSIYTL